MRRVGMKHAWTPPPPCRVLVGVPEEKGPLGRPRHSWENVMIFVANNWIY
jgi:hypothetical protein